MAETTFEPISSRTNGAREYVFPNGYGASVIRQPNTSSLFELAVLDADGDIDYANEHGPCGVLRFLTAATVDGYLAKIAAFPAA